DVADRMELHVNDETSQLQLFVKPILAGGQTIGGMAIVTSLPLEDDVIRTAEAIWMALSVALMRYHIAREAGTRTVSQLLTDLLDGRLERLHQNEEDDLHFTNQPHHILAIRTGSSSSPPSIVEWTLGRLVETVQNRILH